MSSWCQTVTGLKSRAALQSKQWVSGRIWVALSVKGCKGMGICGKRAGFTLHFGKNKAWLNNSLSSTFLRNFKCDLNTSFSHPRVFAPKCASCNQPILPAQVRVTCTHCLFLLEKTAVGTWTLSENTVDVFSSLFQNLRYVTYWIKYSLAVMSLRNIPEGCNVHSTYAA